MHFLFLFSHFFLIACDSDDEVKDEEVEAAELLNQATGAEISAPLANGVYYADQQITFSGRVWDDTDAADSLIVIWNSSIDGDLAIGNEPNSDGNVNGTAYLSAGEHTIALTSQDSAGNLGSSTVQITVNPPNSAPSCTITSPQPGSVGTEGELVTFTAKATDVDIPDNELSVTWATAEEEIGTSTPDSGGEVLFPYDQFTVGSHVVTMTVSDELGATCTDSVIYTVGTPPSLTIETPTNGDMYTEGQAVVFRATVTDAQDSADEIALQWDLNGTSASTQGASSDGIAEFTDTTLGAGDYTLEVTATDSDGLTASTQLSFTVNGQPTVPTVVVTPDPAYTTDALTATASGSTDPEGATITYTYEWLKNGIITSHVSTTVASSETTSGDSWTVRVTPNDGTTNGPSTEASVTIANTSPSIDNITITPAVGVYNDSVLTCSATASDADEELTVNYTWTLQGNTVGLSNSLDLSTVGASPLDEFTCTVSVTDSAGESASSSTSTTIGNRAPSLGAVSITPATGVNNATTVYCGATASDEDGETTNISYEWSVSGNVLGSVDSLTLDPSLVSPGDVLNCTVTASDAAGDSASGDASVTIENSAPIINSIALSPSNPTSQTPSLTCTVNASDSDQDAVTINYTWLVDGVAQAETSNMLGGPFSSGSQVICTASPYDGLDYGATLQDSVSINSTPTAPEVSIIPDDASPDDELLCSVDVESTDADGDTISYSMEWTVDGVAYTGSSTSWPGDTIPPSIVQEGEVWICTATPSDSMENGDTAQATVTISEAIVISGCENMVEEEDHNFGEAYGYDRIAVISNGDIFVTNEANEMIRIDGATWERSCFGTPPCNVKNITTSNDDNLLLLCSSSVYHVDTSTAVATPISADAVNPGPLINDGLRYGIVQLADDTIYVSQSGQLLEIDYTTGQRSINSGNGHGSGDAFPTHYDQYPLAVDESGNIVVMGMGEQTAIDPTTGQRTLTSTTGCESGGLINPNDATQTSDGSIYSVFRYIPWYFGNQGDTVCSAVRHHDAAANVTSVSGFSGNRTAAVTNGTGTEFVYPTGIAAGPDDMLYVIDGHVRAVIQVDPATGNRTVVSANVNGDGPTFADPRVILYGDDGYIYVMDAGPHQHYGHWGMLRVDATNGNREWVSTNWIGTGPYFNYYGNYPTYLYYNNGIVYTDILDFDTTTGNRTSATMNVFADPLQTTTSNGTYRIDGQGVWLEDTAGDIEVSTDNVGNGVHFVDPAGITSLPDGTIIVSDRILTILIAVDPSTGDRSVFSGAGNY